MKTLAKLYVLAIFALSSAAIAHAGTISYDFSYSGGTGANAVSASGVLTTSSTADPNFPGEYDIISLTGTRNGAAMSLVTNCGASCYSQGLNLFDPTSPFFPEYKPLNHGIEYALYFTTPGSENIFQVYTSDYLQHLVDFNPDTSNQIPITFTAAATPEPGTLLLLGTGLLVVAGAFKAKLLMA